MLNTLYFKKKYEEKEYPLPGRRQKEEDFHGRSLLQRVRKGEGSWKKRGKKAGVTTPICEKELRRGEILPYGSGGTSLC